MPPVRAAALLVVALAGVSLRGACHDPPRAGPPPSPRARPRAGQPPATALLYGGKLDLNLASVDDLAALPGIGPERARRIVRRRELRGRYRSIDELADVPGIGDKTLARLRPLVTTPTTPE